jgi:metal-responsive CopG/Arc/MetJ family transcriptional regulator
MPGNIAMCAIYDAYHLSSHQNQNHVAGLCHVVTFQREKMASEDMSSRQLLVKEEIQYTFHIIMQLHTRLQVP